HAQDARRVDQEGLAGRRQAHVAAVALQEFGADVVLQQPDLAAERRLGHVQAFGGAAEVQLLSHRDEAAELADLKHRMSFAIRLDARLACAIVPRTPCASGTRPAAALAPAPDARSGRARPAIPPRSPGSAARTRSIRSA